MTRTGARLETRWLTAVVVVEVIHSSGYHGGYMTVRLAMPAGWTATHGPQTVW